MLTSDAAERYTASSAAPSTSTSARSTATARRFAYSPVRRHSMKWQADFEDSQVQLFRRLAAHPPDPSLRLVILAAHPDDETLGASVVLARFPSSRVIYLTDGAPRDTHLWPPSMGGSREDYAEVRRSEVAKVLAHVGISTEQVSWLGGIDQEAAFDIRTLLARLVEFLHAWRMDL